MQRLRELSQLKAAEYNIYLSNAVATAVGNGEGNPPMPRLSFPVEDMGLWMTSQRPCLLKVVKPESDGIHAFKSMAHPQVRTSTSLADPFFPFTAY